MIARLEVTNFKAFRELDLSLRRLTVLAGLNSAGKSTVIQSLILAQLAGQAEGGVPLNGPFGLALGEASDVIHSQADEGAVIRFVLSGPQGRELIELSAPDYRAVVLDRVGYESAAGTAAVRDGHIGAYLGAERLGPRDLLDIGSAVADPPSVGHQGQFSAHVLVQLERHPVRQELLHPSTGHEGLPRTFLHQTQAWLSLVVRPVQVEATWLLQANAATVRFRPPGLASGWMRPANVGFGISYALPIIVAGLSCLPGSLLMVENPEAHLHPAGQSAIGRFLARVAAAGVQTIVETHSDHVLNGIRLAIAQEEALGAADTVIHFFGAATRPVEIDIVSSGALTAWPSGFFDQSELDLGNIARIGRRG